MNKPHYLASAAFFYKNMCKYYHITEITSNLDQYLLFFNEKTHKIPNLISILQILKEHGFLFTA